MDQMLTDRVAVVTGAAGGLGAATAECFVDHGASVVLLDLEATPLDAVAEPLARRGARVLPIVCDITDEQSVAEAASQTSEEFGRCDALVNNAAIVRWVSLEEENLDDWKRTLDVNLTGAWLCIKHFGGLMKAGGYGSIVNVGSTAGGTVPEFEGGAYSASKAGLEILARQVAIEWGDHNIRANTVAPGMMMAPLFKQFATDPDLLRVRESMVALGRIADPREMSEVIAFLASPQSSFVTGQSIDVDGGMTQMLTRLLPRPATAAATAN